MTVEISYTGDDYERYKEDGIGERLFNCWQQDLPLTPIEEEIKQKVEQDFFPQLDWMFSLKKLVLIKLGDFNNYEDDFIRVRSLLLDNLIDWLISKERPFNSLHHLWIQDFDSPHIFNSSLLPVDARAAIQSYYVKREEWDAFNSGTTPFKLETIENIGGVAVTNSLQVHQHLTKIKYVRGRPAIITPEDEQHGQEYQQVL